MTLEQLRKHKDLIIKLGLESGISNIRVFGSIARGEAGKNSDIDFLVSVAPGVGLRFFDFQIGIEDNLGLKADVVSDKYINRHLQDIILKEAIDL